MAVTFRNTISSVFSSLLAHMKGLEGTKGSDSTVNIRSVAEGEALLGASPNASIILQLLEAKITGRSDVDKQWTQDLRIRVVTEVQSAGAATAEILSKIAQVEDKIESFKKPDGVSGLEDAQWAITFDTSPDHGNIIIADSVRKFSVMVSRGAN